MRKSRHKRLLALKRLPTHKHLLTLGAALWLTAMSPPASAAPQALGLVATNGTVELICDDSWCGAEFTAFCLQPDRFSPVRGTPYDLASAEDLRLTGTTADGVKVALDPVDWLRVQALRTHVAVAISVPRHRMAAEGFAKLELEVGEMVALLPVAEPDDARPLDEVDVASATGPLRGLGALVVDRDQDRMAAARVTNRMVNALPRGRAGRSRDDAELWSRALDSQGGLSQSAENLAQGAYRFCRFAAERSSTSLRSCLQGEHDGFLNFLNSKYWDAMDAGS